VSRKRWIEFTENQLREAVSRSMSWAETLRNLGYCPTGGNPRTIKKYVELWGIDVSHFDPDAARDRALKAGHRERPLDEVLNERSTYARSSLKRRLYREGLKQPICEMCGQGETWRGAQISLILDHVNGVRDDNRLENLRIVCPNCAATLPTHCGRSLKRPRLPRECGHCATTFMPAYFGQRFCSRSCAALVRGKRSRGRPKPHTRKVERPPYEQLLAEIEATSYLAVGRKYGVSDNAVRKWVRWYELECERSAEEASPEGEEAA
jgi:hypothetical protein